MNTKVAIYEQYGFEVPLIIRSKQQLINLPFYSSPTSTSLNKSLHLTFLKNLLTPANLANTTTFAKVGEPDEFISDQQEVFILCQRKYHQSKFTNSFFEKKLKTSATTRNWKTILSLVEIITTQ